MRADGGEQDAWDGRVGERAAGGEGVGGAAGWGGDDAAVGLDDGEEVGVAVEDEVGDVRGGPAVEDEFVEDLEAEVSDEAVGGGGVGGVAGGGRVGAGGGAKGGGGGVGGQACGGGGAGAEVLRGAVDRAGEAHAHVDAHAGAFHYSVEGGFVVVEGEVC